MTEKTLRALAKDYANGVLDKDTYRKARDILICGILSGDTPVVANEFRPPLQAHDLNSTFDKTAINLSAPPKEPRPTTEFVPPPKQPDVFVETKTRGSSLKLYILTGVVVAAIAILILTVFFSVPDETALLATDRNDEPSVGQTTLAEQNIQASELIDGFLNRRDWSEEQLQQFISRWNNLTPEELAKGLTPPLSIQLANAIYKQLLEERSLFGTGNNDAIIARQQTLVDFADALGMDDPRLQVREAPPTLPVNEAEQVIHTSPDAPAANEDPLQ